MKESRRANSQRQWRIGPSMSEVSKRQRGRALAIVRNETGRERKRDKAGEQTGEAGGQSECIAWGGVRSRHTGGKGDRADGRERERVRRRADAVQRQARLHKKAPARAQESSCFKRPSSRVECAVVWISAGVHRQPDTLVIHASSGARTVASYDWPESTRPTVLPCSVSSALHIVRREGRPACKGSVRDVSRRGEHRARRSS
eukprot:6199734-Pleurochrysis_carterae.AAC.2